MWKEKEFWFGLLKARIRLGTWLSIIFIVGISAYFLISSYGHIDHMEQVLPAIVLTADGEIFSTEVNIEGMVTVYPFGGLFGDGVDAFESDTGEGISINAKPVVYDIRFFREDGEYVYRKNDQPSYPAQYVAKRECRELVFCMDVSTVFPEQESGLCLVIAPANNMENAKSILQVIPKEELSEEFSALIKMVLES